MSSKKIIDIIKLRFAELWAVFQLLLAWIFSLYLLKKDIWLICERGTDARDNGFWFYKYLMNEHPEINAYYIISKDSPDRDKLCKLGFKLIRYQSFKHLIYLVKAKYLISTHKNGYSPWPYPFIFRKKYMLGNKRTISLRHGIGIHYTPQLIKEDANFSLIISGSKIEYQYILDNYGYTHDEVKYTGLCRFDNLRDFKTKKVVLIMPTWRRYLNKNNICESNYYHTFIKFLNNKRLKDISAQYGYQFIFYPHHELQPYLPEFAKNVNNKDIIIASKYKYDVQELLKTSAILITDYSSVFFDFAYMNKPVLYYQFDEKEYHSEHYQKGYFDYHNGFGPCLSNEDELINELIRILDNNCKVDKLYSNRIATHFAYNDDNNCKRVFEAIINLNK